MKLTVNVVVAALVVWAVCVTVWMVALSTFGNWNFKYCWESDGIGEKTDSRLIGLLVENTTPPYRKASSTLHAAESSVSVALPTSAVEQRLLHYSEKIQHVAENNSSQQSNCTLVIVTYQRPSLLPKLLNHYCRLAVIEKILVIWNDNLTGVPGMVSTWVKRCKADLKIIKESSNLLSNRYKPRNEIETDCVCLIDDDRIISVYDIQFGFEVWQNFRHLIVGFEESSYLVDSKNHQYTFVPHDRHRFTAYKKSSGQSMSNQIEIVNGTRILHIGNKTYTLGKAAPQKKPVEQEKPDGYSIMQAPMFVHKAYLEMFFDPLIVPSDALEFVQQVNNCEDILLNVMVTKFWHDLNKPQSGALAVKSSLALKDIEKESTSRGGPKPLSKRPGYIQQRSECLSKFAEIYGYLPLHLSNTLAALV